MQTYVKLFRCLVCTSLLVSAPMMADTPPDAEQKMDCTLAGSAVAGMVVHIDPATGMPTSVPTPEQANAIAALQAASANRSSRGLVQEVGPTGGVVVNLRDRFRSPLVATVGSDGAVQTGHPHCQPAGDAS